MNFFNKDKDNNEEEQVEQPKEPKMLNGEKVKFQEIKVSIKGRVFTTVLESTSQGVNITQITVEGKISEDKSHFAELNAHLIKECLI